MTTFEELAAGKKPVAVIGLGYVGLPLAVALSRHFTVIGFDISVNRLEQLRDGHDVTGEVDDTTLGQAVIEYTNDPTRIKDAGIVVVAVPTPIDKHRSPDLTPVVSATTLVGQNLGPGAVVVYESTVYPGLTEELCVPILERESGTRAGEDFFVGYSPERINPGDKVNTLETIVKVVSGQDEATLELLSQFYSTVVKAGVHKASSIKVAEAAKVIENTQRDINIALMNELALIFEKLEIDTLEVLQASGTKWNFLPFRPGLVGGHCIGVDPYYLTYKAQSMGFHPEMILAGRRINDSMGRYVAQMVIKRLIQSGRTVNSARVGILGLTFKENVPDLRNTKVVDIIEELREYCVETIVHDPLADPTEAQEEYGISLAPESELTDFDAVIFAVPHASYAAMSPARIDSMFKSGDRFPLFDIRGMFDHERFIGSRMWYWRL
ncbi:nucleotide sugar dehydrogenase [Desulfovibrio inopinatus]|uniref:nucleotide sugar dehydrogenase n=1 Tax=Desulfovibrio inopinatus TaxID=102109 RepID=UPI000424C16C|nr:nucleotide sugar dehydrogenase [Desulfovibrio inopinatus]